MSENHANQEIVTTQQAVLPTCDVSIDIGQILAANQALLKNMARRMEQLENRLAGMEKGFCEQRLLLTEQNKTTLLLAAPPREIKPWQPESVEKIDADYLSKFSFYDRLFRPWKMRRHSAKGN